MVRHTTENFDECSRKSGSNFQGVSLKILVLRTHRFDSSYPQGVRVPPVKNHCAKANLHCGVARSSRARFFVLLRRVILRSCTAGHANSAIKQTKNRARLLLATPRCRLVSDDNISLLLMLNSSSL